MAFALVALVSINTSAQKRTTQNMKDKKTLAAFFSRADENYNVGTIKVGNT